MTGLSCLLFGSKLYLLGLKIIWTLVCLEGPRQLTYIAGCWLGVQHRSLFPSSWRLGFPQHAVVRGLVCFMWCLSSRMVVPSSKVRSFSSLNAQPENLRSTPSIHSVGQIKPQATYHTLKKTDKLHHRIAEWQKSAGSLIPYIGPFSR